MYSHTTFSDGKPDIISLDFYTDFTPRGFVSKKYESSGRVCSNVKIVTEMCKIVISMQTHLKM